MLGLSLAERGSMTFRVYDLKRDGRHLAAFGLDPEMRGGVFNPGLFFAWKGGRGYIGGWGFHFVLPHLNWRWAYRLRRVGGLSVYKVQYAIVSKIARRPR